MGEHLLCTQGVRGSNPLASTTLRRPEGAMQSDPERANEVSDSKGHRAATDSHAWYFYMVRCSDGSLYCGIALDAVERLRAHNAGLGADYTARRRPVMLVYTEAHRSKSAARRREMQIKRWRAEKKEMLVPGFPSTGSGRANPLASTTLRRPEGAMQSDPERANEVSESKGRRRG